MTVTRVSVVLVLLASFVAAALYFQRPVRDDVWRINFAPDMAPDVPGFVNVDAGQDYNRWRGYGWLDTTGPVESGR